MEVTPREVGPSNPLRRVEESSPDSSPDHPVGKTRRCRRNLGLGGGVTLDSR